MTTTADVKALLDPIEGLTETYREAWVPDDAAFPYASILDPVSNAPALSGDARTLARRRLIQVDLWQSEADEIDGLVDTITAALDGTAMTSGGRLRVIEVVLIPEDEDVVHHAFTLSWARV